MTCKTWLIEEICDEVGIFTSGGMERWQLETLQDLEKAIEYEINWRGGVLARFETSSIVNDLKLAKRELRKLIRYRQKQAQAN